MASESITVRFTSGAWEYAVTERVPELGDILLRDGKTWTVAAVGDSVDDHRVITMVLPHEVENEPSHVKNSARWPRWG